MSFEGTQDSQKYTEDSSNMLSILQKRETGSYSPMKLFDVMKANRNFIQRLRLERRLEVHRGCVNTICWNENGTSLLSGSDDQHLVVSDPFTGQTRASIRSGHHSNIFCAKFLPSSNDLEIVSCSGAGSIYYTQVDREDMYGKCLFDCHTGTTYELVVVPNEARTFLTCGEDGTVRWYDLRIKTSCNKERCKEDVLINCRNAVTSISVDPILPYQLATACADGSVRVFDRRMLGTRLSGTYSSRLMTGLVTRFIAPLENQAHRITSLNYSPFGHEVLVSYSAENVYLFNTQIQESKEFSKTEAGSDRKNSENGEEASGSSGTDPSNQPPTKRLRLRGDWSDTGPNARPERERTEESEGMPQVNLMQRMSDMLTRWLDGSMRRRPADEQEAADAPSAGTAQEGADNSNPVASGSVESGVEGERREEGGVRRAVNESSSVRRDEDERGEEVDVDEDGRGTLTEGSAELSECSGGGERETDSTRFDLSVPASNQQSTHSASQVADITHAQHTQRNITPVAEIPQESDRLDSSADHFQSSTQIGCASLTNISVSENQTCFASQSDCSISGELSLSDTKVKYERDSERKDVNSSELVYEPEPRESTSGHSQFSTPPVSTVTREQDSRHSHYYLSSPQNPTSVPQCMSSSTYSGVGLHNQPSDNPQTDIMLKEKGTSSHSLHTELVNPDTTVGEHAIPSGVSQTEHSNVLGASVKEGEGEMLSVNERGTICEGVSGLELGNGQGRVSANSRTSPDFQERVSTHTSASPDGQGSVSTNTSVSPASQGRESGTPGVVVSGQGSSPPTRLEPVISLHYSDQGTTASTIQVGYASFNVMDPPQSHPPLLPSTSSQSMPGSETVASRAPMLSSTHVSSAALSSFQGSTTGGAIASSSSLSMASSTNSSPSVPLSMSCYSHVSAVSHTDSSQTLESGSATVVSPSVPLAPSQDSSQPSTDSYFSGVSASNDCTRSESSGSGHFRGPVGDMTVESESEGVSRKGREASVNVEGWTPLSSVAVPSPRGAETVTVQVSSASPTDQANSCSGQSPLQTETPQTSDVTTEHTPSTSMATREVTASTRQRRIGHSGPPTGDFQLDLNENNDDDSDDEDDSQEGMQSRSVPFWSYGASSNDERHYAAMCMQTMYRRRMEEREKQAMATIYQPSPLHMYTGHRNSRTMIKEANFWGEKVVMSGSDCGRIFMWDRDSTQLVMLLEADRHVVNCLQPHPTHPILASSGIDYDVKIWTPLEAEPSFDVEMAEEVMRRNQIMLEETRDTITVPAAFMLRVLASLNQIRAGRAGAGAGAGRQQEDSPGDSD